MPRDPYKILKDTLLAVTPDRWEAGEWVDLLVGQGHLMWAWTLVPTDPHK